jgi:hypothetical protein
MQAACLHAGAQGGGTHFPLPCLSVLCCLRTGLVMPIRLLLEHDHAFTPEDVKVLIDAFEDTLRALNLDPPPLRWSDLRYVFDIQEDCNGKEAIQA